MAPTHEGYPRIDPERDWCGEFHPAPSFQALEKALRLQRERDENAAVDEAEDVAVRPIAARPVRAAKAGAR
jgi:hypothetical protein